MQYRDSNQQANDIPEWIRPINITEYNHTVHETALTIKCNRVNQTLSRYAKPASKQPKQRPAAEVW